MYRVFNFEMYSLVIKIAILVKSAVLLEIMVPALGFNTANVHDFFVEADLKKVSVISKNFFFLVKLYTSSSIQYLF